MGVEVDTEQLEIAFDDLSDDAAKELANRWFSASQEKLYAGGDQHDYDVYPVAQSGVPPQKDGDAWKFGYLHPATVYFEFGTPDHEVEAQEAEMLAFEWPDAPQEVREMFSDTFPTVFFESVEVSGINALRFVQNGRTQARNNFDPDDLE